MNKDNTTTEIVKPKTETVTAVNRYHIPGTTDIYRCVSVDLPHFNGTLNVREEPAFNGKIKTTVKHGATFKAAIDETVPGWTALYNSDFSVKGYVRTEYIKDISEK